MNSSGLIPPSSVVGVRSGERADDFVALAELRDAGDLGGEGGDLVFIGRL